MLHYIVMPFYDHEGKPQVRNAIFTTEGRKLDIRLATRLLTKAYLKLIGRVVHKSLIRKLVKEKFSCEKRDITTEDVVDAITLFEAKKKSTKEFV